MSGEGGEGTTTILSTTGVHQGDPLGPLLFAVGQHPVVTMLSEVAPNLQQNSWFLDDGVIVGTKEDHQRVVDVITSEGPPRGLFFSLTKSLVWCPGHDPSDMDPLNRGITRHTEDGTTLLGAPIGNWTYEEEVLESRIFKIEEVLARLHLLEDPHQEFALLRSCFSLPKLSYALRTLDTAHHQDPLSRFDAAIRRTLEGLLGTPLTETQWDQASLPVSMGGLGLRRLRPTPQALSWSPLGPLQP